MIQKKTKHLFGLYASELRPLNVMIEITNACNFDCIHCYIKKKETAFINSEKFKEAIISLKKLGCFKITFTGGEPLTHPEFLKIIELTEQYGFIYSIFTNGYLLTENLIERLNSSKFFTGFHISLYGITEAVHDEITKVKGSFKKLVSMLELLKKYTVKFILKTAIMKNNFSEWEKIMTFCEKNNYKHAMEFTFLPCEDKSKNTADLMIDKSQLFDVNRILSEKYNKKLILKNEKKPDIFFNQHVCVAGKNKLCISYEGEVYPCIILRKSAGNIFNDKLENIWYNSKWLEELRKVRNKDIEGCNNCKIIDYCRYKCPGVSYLYYGTIYKKPEVRCLIAKLNKEVIENEKV